MLANKNTNTMLNIPKIMKPYSERYCFIIVISMPLVSIKDVAKISSTSKANLKDKSMLSTKGKTLGLTRICNATTKSKVNMDRYTCTNTFAESAWVKAIAKAYARATTVHHQQS